MLSSMLSLTFLQSPIYLQKSPVPAKGKGAPYISQRALFSTKEPVICTNEPYSLRQTWRASNHSYSTPFCVRHGPYMKEPYMSDRIGLEPLIFESPTCEPYMKEHYVPYEKVLHFRHDSDMTQTWHDSRVGHDSHVTWLKECAMMCVMP